ncbi:MAG: hypothetical protein V2A62_01710 [Candidatus Woesearchaeota archaeon]
MTEPTVQKKYRAEYRINAYYCECMTWLPDPETHHRRLDFEAIDDFAAIDTAIEKQNEVGKNFLHPTVTLERVVQFQEREVKCLKEYLKARKQLYR